jgi:membrane protein
VVIIAIISFIYGADAVEGNIYGSLKSMMGPEAALQIQNLVKSASLSGKSTMAAIIGGATLIFGASTVFAQIQSSLNIIWGIKAKPKSGFIKLILNRLLSFSLVLSIGFLLIVSLSLNTALVYVSDHFQHYFENGLITLFDILNFFVNFIVLSVLFGYIFKVLPDAQIRLKDVAIGAMVTALLFIIGKSLISLYIGYSNFSNTFGASAAIIIILVWIYYSSLILYFGAEFTKAWAVKFGYKIYPDKYAVTTKIVEITMEHEPVQTLNKEEQKA